VFPFADAASSENQCWPHATALTAIEGAAQIRLFASQFRSLVIHTPLLMSLK
jgi:hypothetical protein